MVLGPWLPAAVEALSQALHRETVPWIRPSLLLALGAVGGPQARAVLEAWPATEPSEVAARSKALDRTAPPPLDRPVRHRLDDAITVELWTHPGLETLLENEVQERLDQRVRRLKPGRLALETDDLYRLYALRTMTKVILPLFSGPRTADLGPSLAQRGRDEGAFDRLLAWHTPAQGPLPYRLEIRGPGLARGQQRTLLQNLVPALRAVAPHLVNSPSRYQVELRLLLYADSYQLLARLCALPDDRFTYRHNDVPAALDPVIAAALVRALPKPRPSARVLDPFCGSGTLLIERGLLAPYKQLVGIDIAPQAVRAAKKNIAAAGLQQATIQQGDAAALKLQAPFDELIANLPFGIRAGDHASNRAIYAALFDQLHKLLAAKARIALYTQEQKLTQGLFKGCKSLRLTRTFRVEAGGLQPTVFIACRR